MSSQDSVPTQQAQSKPSHGIESSEARRLKETSERIPPLLNTTATINTVSPIRKLAAQPDSIPARTPKLAKVAYGKKANSKLPGNISPSTPVNPIKKSTNTYSLPANSRKRPRVSDVSTSELQVPSTQPKQKKRKKDAVNYEDVANMAKFFSSISPAKLAASSHLNKLTSSAATKQPSNESKSSDEEQLATQPTRLESSTKKKVDPRTPRAKKQLKTNHIESPNVPLKDSPISKSSRTEIPNSQPSPKPLGSNSQLAELPDQSTAMASKSRVTRGNTQKILRDPVTGETIRVFVAFQTIKRLDWAEKVRRLSGKELARKPGNDTLNLADRDFVPKLKISPLLNSFM